MASVNRIDSIYDVAAIAAQHDAVKKLVQDSIAQILEARSKSIDFNINTKTFDDYNKKVKELEKNIAAMDKATLDAVKASTALSKSKEAEAKAQLANTRATTAATKETERQANASKKAAEAVKQNERPYKQLALAFKIASERAQDLGAKYGTLDKRAQAAAKEANGLNNRLKEIDKSIGNNQRNVGNYGSALDGVGGKLKSLGLQFLAFAGLGSFFSGAIDEFVEMDKNVRILQNTLKNAGVPEAFDRIANRADALAKQFKFLDNDDILKAFNQLIVYGKLTEDQINDLIPVIINFATATGQDLGAATSTIIKALEGNGKALKEFGINIKDAKSTTEAFGIVMTELAPKVDGVGEAFGETASGGLAAARQEFKNLQEEVGGQLVPVLVTLLGWVNKLFTGFKFLADGVGRFASDMGDLFGGDFGVLIGEGEGQLKRTAETMARIEKLAAKGIADIAIEGKSAGEAIGELNQRLFLQQTLLEKAKKNTSGVFNTADVERYEKAVRVTRLALAQLFKLDSGGGVIGGGDPNKLFSAGSGKDKKGRDTAEADRRAEFEILKNSIELDREFQKTRLNNAKLSYEERLEALIAYTNRSQQLIEVSAQFELGNADLTATEQLKIQSDKNAALIRLARETADELGKITTFEFKVDTSKITEGIKGIPKELQKVLDAWDKFVDDNKKKRDELIKSTKEALLDLSTELQGAFFDIFTNALEQQKNAIQDQIDLLELQKQKDIEVANQTITNAQDRADAIAVIEARAAAKRQQLELKQRQLDQQRARFEKARAVADIIQSTAVAVVNALGAKPWTPANIALAAIVGAIGAVQIARTLAQPIPRYAEGISNHPGGPMIVGDGGKSEGIILPDGSVYKSPATDTLMTAPAGTQVIPDYATMTKAPVFNIDMVDTTAELRKGFGQVVKAVKNIPQPVIHAEKAWVQAHKQGSNFRNYLNRAI